ncbi:serine O-acetyltransferase [Nocardiaceae bacterium NPDC056970]
MPANEVLTQSKLHAHDRITDHDDLGDFKSADLLAYGLTKWRFHYRLKHPTLYYQRVMRDVEFLQSKGNLYRVAAEMRRAYLKFLGIWMGLSIPPGVFGRGLSVPHYGSVVVNDKVRAGRFCRIHSATNLGEVNGEAPRLGDGVYVGPGAVLYGGINLGSGAVVGANSVVNKDVQRFGVVAGAPARIISVSGSGEVMPEGIAAELSRLWTTTPVDERG